MGCRRIHFIEWLQKEMELVVSFETVLGRKPLVVIGGEAGKTDGGVLVLREEVLGDKDEESGLVMEEKLESISVS